jgi:monoamine oxidase
MKTTKRIVVIGAGAAGLYTAALLKEAGYEVVLLEASDRVGGRVHSLTDWAETPIELGAEFIHGDSHLLYRYCQERQIELYPEGESYFIFQNQVRSHAQLYEQEWVENFLEFYHGHHLYKGDEIALDKYLQQELSDEELALALPYYQTFAAALGTSLPNLGMKSLGLGSKRWSAGEENFRINVPYSTFLQDMVEFLEDELVLNAAVRHINYADPSNVQVVTEDCRMFAADCVVVAVPLTILKQSFIDFLPPLPQEKQEAIEVIGMDKAGIKIAIKFGQRFWNQRMDSLIGSEVVSEYWVSTFCKPVQEPILTAFAMGEKAEKLSAMGEKKALEAIMGELDRLFHKAASECFLDYYWYDWKNNPYIGGAYSYASPNSHFQRHKLAQNVERVLFFAGEATNTNGHFATVFGALETAEAAFEEIKSLYS